MNENGNLVIIPVKGIKEVQKGDEIADLIIDQIELKNGDVIVVTQKIVSKAEGAVVKLDSLDPAAHKRQVVLDESKRIVRQRGDLIISETRHGFVCANAGVDLSNVPNGYVAKLPVDSDKSAYRIKMKIENKLLIKVAVIITDTFGRPWRKGLTDVAIGVAGILPILDLKGTKDSLGKDLVVTEVCIVDELAAAAELVMNKSSSIPVAVIRGIDPEWFIESPRGISEIVREPADDLFR
jgi:coenzyme F420-0:L-glutamate ligase/coenzyme F420-1:gamma-L-glutamate ligase